MENKKINVELNSIYQSIMEVYTGKTNEVLNILGKSEKELLKSKDSTTASGYLSVYSSIVSSEIQNKIFWGNYRTKKDLSDLVSKRFTEITKKIYQLDLNSINISNMSEYFNDLLGYSYYTEHYKENVKEIFMLNDLVHNGQLLSIPNYKLHAKLHREINSNDFVVIEYLVLQDSVVKDRTTKTGRKVLQYSRKLDNIKYLEIMKYSDYLDLFKKQSNNKLMIKDKSPVFKEVHNFLKEGDSILLNIIHHSNVYMKSRYFLDSYYSFLKNYQTKDVVVISVNNENKYSMEYKKLQKDIKEKEKSYKYIVYDRMSNSKNKYNTFADFKELQKFIEKETDNCFTKSNLDRLIKYNRTHEKRFIFGYTDSDDVTLEFKNLVKSVKYRKPIYKITSSTGKINHLTSSEDLYNFINDYYKDNRLKVTRKEVSKIINACKETGKGIAFNEVGNEKLNKLTVEII